MSISLYPDYIEDFEEYLKTTQKPTLVGFMKFAKKLYDDSRYMYYESAKKANARKKWWNRI